MKKLNQKKVMWIVREMGCGKPTRLAAGVQKISLSIVYVDWH